MSTGVDTTANELYRQVCLAADEYLSFRNAMMATPYLTVSQIEGALRRADKIIGLLRMLRGKQAVEAAIPAPTAPGLVSSTTSAPVYPNGTVLAIGKAPVTQDGAPLPPCSAWQCPSCRELLWVAGPLAPTGCPACGAQFGG